MYLNDTVVFLQSPRDHIKHVRQILSLLEGAKAALILKPFNLLTGTADHPVHVIRPRRLKIEWHTTNSIKRLMPPTNITEICLFIGLCNVIHCFVPNIAQLALGLNKKVKKDEPKYSGVLTAEELSAVQEL